MIEGTIERVFKRGLHSELKLPGELPDFLAFLGVESAEQLEKLSWEKLETLPVIAGRLKIQEIPKTSTGRYQEGNRYVRRIKERQMWNIPRLDYVGHFIWWEVMEDEMELQKGERILGLGQISYDEAALNGLLSLWELVSLREGWRIKRPRLDKFEPKHLFKEDKHPLACVVRNILRLLIA